MSRLLFELNSLNDLPFDDKDSYSKSQLISHQFNTFLEPHLRYQLILEHSMSQNEINGIQYAMKKFELTQLFPIFTAIKVKTNDPCLSILDEILCYCILSGNLTAQDVLDERNGFKSNVMEIKLIEPNRLRKQKIFGKLQKISNIFNYIECSEDMRHLIEILLTNNDDAFLIVSSNANCDIGIKINRLKEFGKILGHSRHWDNTSYEMINIAHESK